MLLTRIVLPHWLCLAYPACSAPRMPRSACCRRGHEAANLPRACAPGPSPRRSALRARPPPAVWTSTLQRTIVTASGLPYPKVQWKALDEIQVGPITG